MILFTVGDVVVSVRTSSAWLLAGLRLPLFGWSTHPSIEFVISRHLFLPGASLIVLGVIGY